MGSEVKNILLVRTDRIGDVILSLPMLPLLREKFPNASISVLARQYTKELLEGHSCVSDILIYEHEGSPFSLLRTLQLIRSHRFDVGILPYPRFRTAVLVALAGIPIRIGTGYRWYSLLFNRKVFEHRKDAKRHEVEYNLHLLRQLGIEANGEVEFELAISNDDERKVEHLLSEFSLREKDRFAVLHPGSGGSARDWKAENFSRLGDELSAGLGFKIVLTGGNGEESLVSRVAEGMKARSISLAGKLSLKELAALAKKAAVFVSNSTGPLHIAAIVGTPVVGFYPPIVQCSPSRWGPYTDRKKVFVSDAGLCPLCRGSACRSDICMDQIRVEEVLRAIKELLND